MLAGGAALTLAACTPGPWSGAPGDARPVPGRAYQLVYVGARDCSFCHWWEETEEPGFLASPARGKLSYRRLVFARFADTTSDAVWPEDIRWVRDRLGLTSGTPRFILLREGEVVLQTAGVRGWREHMLPALEAVTV